jgi:hypothetical protein
VLLRHWSRLDKFEGPCYQRVVRLVRTEQRELDACIYVALSLIEVEMGMATTAMNDKQPAVSRARLSGCTDSLLAVPVPTIERLGEGSVRCMLGERVSLRVMQTMCRWSSR